MAETNPPYSRSVHVDLPVNGRNLVLPLSGELTHSLFETRAGEILKIYRSEPPENELGQPVPGRPGTYGWHRVNPQDPELEELKLIGLQGFRNMYKEAEILTRFRDSGILHVPHLTLPLREKIAYLGRGNQTFPVRQAEFGMSPVYGRVATEFDQQNQDLVIKRAVEILTVLSQAQSLGVSSHNDLRPENLIIEEDGLGITVIDWGAANLNGASSDVFMANERYGSIQRMLSRVGEPKTDVISLAKIMLYWLSGGDSGMELIPDGDAVNGCITLTEAYLMYLQLNLAEDLKEAERVIKPFIEGVQNSDQVAFYYKITQKARMNSKLAKLLLGIIQTDFSAFQNYPDPISLDSVPDTEEFRKLLIACMY